MFVSLKERRTHLFVAPTKKKKIVRRYFQLRKVVCWILREMFDVGSPRKRFSCTFGALRVHRHFFAYECVVVQKLFFTAQNFFITVILDPRLKIDADESIVLILLNNYDICSLISATGTLMYPQDLFLAMIPLVVSL